MRERKVGALGVDTASIDYGAVEGLHRPPDRQRGQRPGPRERGAPRRAAGDRRLGRRAADEDRRRLRRARCGSWPCSREPAPLRPPSLPRSAGRPAADRAAPRRDAARPRERDRDRGARPLDRLRVLPPAARDRGGDRRGRSATRSPASSASAARCRTRSRARAACSSERSRAVGPRHPAAGRVRAGDRVASLVSLTLTPLHLETIGDVHVETERVDVDGDGDPLRADALRAPARRLPRGGRAGGLRRGRRARDRAPRRPRRADGPRHRHGQGRPALPRGGARDGRHARAACSPSSPPRAAADRARALGFADDVFAIDARDPVADARPRSKRRPTGRMADLVVNVANASGTEAASVLCARDDGTVLFFGMATSFSAAALGAEGLAKPTHAADRQRLRPGARRDGARTCCAATRPSPRPSRRSSGSPAR